MWDVHTQSRASMVSGSARPAKASSNLCGRSTQSGSGKGGADMMGWNRVNHAQHHTAEEKGRGCLDERPKIKAEARLKAVPVFQYPLESEK